MTLNYFGKKVKVIKSNETHVLIEFETGVKICANKNTFKE